MCGCICKLFHNITQNLCQLILCLVKVLEVLCAGYFTAPGPLCLLSIHLWSSFISTATKQITHYLPSSIYALSILMLILFCSFHLLNLWLSQLSQMQDIRKLTSKNVKKAQLCITAYILFSLRRKGICKLVSFASRFFRFLYQYLFVLLLACF